MFSGFAGFTSEALTHEHFPDPEREGLAQTGRIGSIPHTPVPGVSVWYVRHAGHMVGVRFEEALTPADFAEFAEFRNPTTRRRSLATRELLRMALSDATGGSVLPREWAFRRNAYGKPYLVAPVTNLHFSCSHTHLVSVVAVSRSQPVGVDIEGSLPLDDDPSLIEEYFTAGERRALMAIAPERRTEARTRLWSLKESVVKMLGMGLALDISKLEFDIEADRLKSSQTPEVNVSGLRLATWSIPNKAQHFSVALAVKN